jgi:hypothetical protein
MAFILIIVFTQSLYEKIWIILFSKDWNANITICTECIGKIIRYDNNGLKAHRLIIFGFTNQCLVHCLESG